MPFTKRKSVRISPQRIIANLGRIQRENIQSASEIQSTMEETIRIAGDQIREYEDSLGVYDKDTDLEIIQMMMESHQSERERCVVWKNGLDLLLKNMKEQQRKTNTLKKVIGSTTTFKRDSNAKNSNVDGTVNVAMTEHEIEALKAFLDSKENQHHHSKEEIMSEWQLRKSYNAQINRVQEEMNQMIRTKNESNIRLSTKIKDFQKVATQKEAANEAEIKELRSKLIKAKMGKKQMEGKSKQLERTLQNVQKQLDGSRRRESQNLDGLRDEIQEIIKTKDIQLHQLQNDSKEWHDATRNVQDFMRQWMQTQEGDVSWENIIASTGMFSILLVVALYLFKTVGWVTLGECPDISCWLT